MFEPPNWNILVKMGNLPQIGVNSEPKQMFETTTTQCWVCMLICLISHCLDTRPFTRLKCIIAWKTLGIHPELVLGRILSVSNKSHNSSKVCPFKTLYYSAISDHELYILTLFFSLYTKYVIPKSLKGGNWLNKLSCFKCSFRKSPYFETRPPPVLDASHF